MAPHVLVIDAPHPFYPGMRGVKSLDFFGSAEEAIDGLCAWVERLGDEIDRRGIELYVLGPDGLALDLGEVCYGLTSEGGRS